LKFQIIVTHNVIVLLGVRFWRAYKSLEKLPALGKAISGFFLKHVCAIHRPLLECMCSTHMLKKSWSLLII